MRFFERFFERKPLHFDKNEFHFQNLQLGSLHQISVDLVNLQNLAHFGGYFSPKSLPGLLTGVFFWGGGGG